jgi:hypothetical protein
VTGVVENKEHQPKRRNVKRRKGEKAIWASPILQLTFSPLAAPHFPGHGTELVAWIRKMEPRRGKIPRPQLIAMTDEPPVLLWATHLGNQIYSIT